MARPPHRRIPKPIRSTPKSTKEELEGDGRDNSEAKLSIDAKGLKALLDTKAPMVLLDARSGKYDDGQRIPGAKQMNPDATDADIAKAAPSKDALIVAYCTSLKCPASKMLAENLVKLGYKNVIKYPGGIEEWVKLGNPVEKAAK